MKYHTKVDAFFNEEEKEQIKVTAIGVEARTIGEIATVVIDQSSDYKEAEVIGGVFVGSLVALIITAMFFHASVWAFIPFAFILFFPARLLFQKMPVSKVVFISKSRKEKAVRERALRAFYERGLYKTKKHTGVLFFLSLLERKVWVLADKGIHGKIQQQTLNRFASMVSKGIQEGRAADALCEAITDMGELLWEHYPITDADTDELPNVVICEQDDSSTDKGSCSDDPH
jgi:putative membrane protein